MKKILHNVIKNKTLFLLKELGGGLNEIIIDINLSFDNINSLEYMNNVILTHSFNNYGCGCEDDCKCDISYNYDDLDEDDKLKIYKELRACLAYH